MYKYKKDQIYIGPNKYKSKTFNAFDVDLEKYQKKENHKYDKFYLIFYYLFLLFVISLLFYYVYSKLKLH